MKTTRWQELAEVVETYDERTYKDLQKIVDMLHSKDRTGRYTGFRAAWNLLQGNVLQARMPGGCTVAAHIAQGRAELGRKLFVAAAHAARPPAEAEAEAEANSVTEAVTEFDPTATRESVTVAA